ncbi:MAG: histidine kinase, partial [Bacteroidales bacterium]|nr:histidine kinase [Bacteroidales bacterium]
KAKSEAYLKTGQKTKALETYEQYASILDRLYQKSEMKYENISSLNKQLRSQQNRIEFLEKDKTIYDAQMHALNQEKQTQKAQITYQQRYIILLAGGLLLLSLTVIMLISRNKIQRRHNAFLTLRSLRNQMNPHFIFNSLNSLNNFIVKKDEISANRYLSRFSGLMRSVLYYATDDFISLETEIDILKNYLELEKMRFQDKFSYILNVDSKVEVKRFNIPPMIIQPYIENAIWHGLRYKETKGNLSVDITMLGDMLKITIQDDGIGRKKSGAMKTKNQEKKKSSGIRATQKRLDELQKIYKKNIRYSISDLFENGEGTTVEILLPEINLNHE